jgi:hypothetical protein
MGECKSGFTDQSLIMFKMKINKLLLALCILVSAAACHEEQKPASDETKTGNPDSIRINPATTVNPAPPYVSIDISPMDMSYYPVDYPKLKMASGAIDPPLVRVIYSRPHLAKRHLFHDLLKYEEPWRLGANEATEIDFYKPVTIQDKKIKPGRYIIYAIPHPQSWTIVLNSNIDSWGLQQDAKKDIQLFDVPISTGNPVQEYFTMLFEKNDTSGANLVIAWDDVVSKLPISF